MKNSIVKQINMRILLLLVLVACNNKSSGTNKTEKENLIITQPQNKIIPKIFSGRYGEMSIAIDSNNNLTGVYEYYDVWDDKFKEYTQICKLYFSGHYSENQNYIDIKAYWPGTKQKLIGKIKIIQDSISKIGMFLNDAPNCYADVDFTKENTYSRKLDDKKNWIQVRLIKSDKAKFYNSPDISKIRKGYIVKSDIVKVISKKEGWLQIEYNPPNDNTKSTKAWIREEDVW